MYCVLQQNSGKREEILKPTNPIAQKAVLNSGGYKVSPRPVAKIKPKSLHGLLAGTKVRTYLPLSCICMKNKTKKLWHDLVPKGAQEKRTEVLENKVDRM